MTHLVKGITTPLWATVFCIFLIIAAVCHVTRGGLWEKGFNLQFPGQGGRMGGASAVVVGDCISPCCTFADKEASKNEFNTNCLALPHVPVLSDRPSWSHHLKISTKS